LLLHHIHLRNILRNFPQNVYLQAATHCFRVCVFLQLSTKISDDIISPGSDGYSHCSSGKAPFDLRPNVRSSSHKYSGAWRLLQNLIQQSYLTRYPCAHSSRELIHMNMRFSEQAIYSIFTISGSRGPHPPRPFFWSS